MLPTTDHPSDWATEILQFWFCETAPQAWFDVDDAFDRRLRERFLDQYEQVAGLPVAACLGDARLALAAVIVLDQFPRNMFRGTARAFATDARAREIAERALASSLDAGLSKDERMFLYLPFEHAEDAQVQDRCVALMATLQDPELLRWAVAHKEIIDRFGRFPHRNAALGRTSTPEEIAFLEQPGTAL